MASIHIDRSDSPTFLNGMTRDEAVAAFDFTTTEEVIMDDDYTNDEMEAGYEAFEMEVFEAADRSSFYRRMKAAHADRSFAEVFEVKLIIEATHRSTFVARIFNARIPF